MNKMLAALVISWSLACSVVHAQTIDLSGRWALCLDPEDIGTKEQWHTRILAEPVQLPGALQNQGYGSDIAVDTRWTGVTNQETWLNGAGYAKYRQPGNVKVPFCLQPQKHYVGPAWYQRKVQIPPQWQGRHVLLTLERSHWETRVWLGDRSVGRRDSLCTPHEYDLGSLRPGDHVLTIRVDNRIIVDVGDWSHSVSDHTQGNWNGVIGRIELAARPPVWLEDLQVFPRVAKRTIIVRGRIGNDTGAEGKGTIALSIEPSRAVEKAPSPSVVTDVSWRRDGGTFECELPPNSIPELWDEFHPALYRLRASLNEGMDTKVVTVGLREVTTTPDKLIAINGRKTFLRGTLECCIFPLTGYPPAEVEPWRRIIGICKEHGLNHLRFHSWCPPEAAFQAADELGFYYQVECGVWSNPGNGTALDAWLWQESERIVRAYGNHPSFVLLASGNEPHGPKHEEYLSKWVSHWKTKDPRRLHTTASAYPLLPENDYHVDHQPRGPKGWGGKDYTAQVQGHRVPVIVHEMGQWCVYPNFDEMARYTGPLKPGNFEIFRDSLTEHGLFDQWRDFLRASGRLQVLCYKEEIEAALRTPGISGIQLLDLHDFPGQGTALVGVLDAFWEAKGYVTPAEFRRFYDSTVLLARMDKRVWTTDETLAADVTVAHFGPAPLQNGVATWKLTDDKGLTVTTGRWPARTVPVDRGVPLGRLTVDCDGLAAPAKYKLVVGLEGTPYENDWTVWLYPARLEADPAHVLVSTALDEPTLARLAEGGKVLLLATKTPPEFPEGSFTPIFWNRYMFNTQRTQTLGLLCDPRHPALKLFPTDFHSEWQWADILPKSRAVVMDELPRGLRPIVQIIDDWNTNRKLGLIFECRLDRGRLLVCSADLAGSLDERPAARQLRHSLLRYMASDAFDPGVELTIEQLRSLYREPTVLQRIGATATADSAQADYEAALAIDDNPATLWHTAWEPPPPLPHHLIIDLQEPRRVQGLRYLPRQDMANGRIAEYQVYASRDAQDWGAPLATGRWPNNAQMQTVRFEQPVIARYLKLLAVSEVSGNAFTSAAEVDVLLE